MADIGTPSKGNSAKSVVTYVDFFRHVAFAHIRGDGPGYIALCTSISLISDQAIGDGGKQVFPNLVLSAGA